MVVKLMEQFLHMFVAVFLQSWLPVNNYLTSKHLIGKPLRNFLTDYLGRERASAPTHQFRFSRETNSTWVNYFKTAPSILNFYHPFSDLIFMFVCFYIPRSRNSSTFGYWHQKQARAFLQPIFLGGFVSEHLTRSTNVMGLLFGFLAYFWHVWPIFGTMSQKEVLSWK